MTTHPDGRTIPVTVRIVPTEMRFVAGFNAAVDAVARERRYLSFVEGPTLSRSEAFVAALLSGGGVQFLALDAELVVGWCDIIRMPLEGFQHCGRLGMGLLPQYRGLGLGHQLAAAAIACAKGAGVQRIELEVFSSNQPAVRLYERLGFVKEGLKRRARFLDGRYDDNVQMALLLDDRNAA